MGCFLAAMSTYLCEYFSTSSNVLNTNVGSKTKISTSMVFATSVDLINSEKSLLADRFLFGYQGWFRTPDDLGPDSLDPGSWTPWGSGTEGPTCGHGSVDFLPDVSIEIQNRIIIISIY